MRASVFRKTLRDLGGATLAWSLGVAAIAALNVLLYPTVQRMEGLAGLLASLPPVFKAMIGDLEAVTRLDGFLWVKLFDPLPLLLSVFGVSHGAQLLAGEVEQKHVDLLLSRPLSRWRVVLAKFLAMAASLTLVVLATALTVLVCARSVDAGAPAARLVIATLNALPLSWFFAAVALLASSLARRPRSAALPAGALVVAAYVLETLRMLSPVLAAWRPFSPYAYHKASYPLSGPADPGAALLLLALAAAGVGAAMLVWERRDLAA
jgi:ABC-2 type transport system permease protein